MEEERDTRNWEALMELGHSLPDHEERLARAKAGVVRAMAANLREEALQGKRDAMEVEAEAMRLLNHPGCPPDARAMLEDLLLATRPLAPLD